jgi:hypothetical protein
MNIQNVSVLADLLKMLGFENKGSSLLKRICFKPDNFILSQRIEKGNDHLKFHLFFEKSSKQNDYTLMYYDAILQKAIVLPDATINGIDTGILEKQMDEIDWKDAFDFDVIKQWSVEDNSSWEQEKKIESIIECLSDLEKIEDGKAIALDLKLKYWADISYHEFTGIISSLKNKSEISQRFYFFEGQSGISVDEAYRFLQNRWLEKQMQVKRKQTEPIEVDNSKNDSKASSRTGLLKKKRFSRSKTIKPNKPVQQ